MKMARKVFCLQTTNNLNGCVSGSYYNFDSSGSDHHDSIMSDQLAGQWFLKASEIPDDSVSIHSYIVNNNSILCSKFMDDTQ